MTKQACPHCDGELEFVQQVERRRRVRTWYDIKNVLAVMVVMIWALVQWHLITDVVDKDMRELVARVLGTQDAIVVLVFQFFFGRSQGDDDKAEEMSRRADNQAMVAQQLAAKVEPPSKLPTPVQVVNPPDQPVPTTATDGDHGNER